MLEKIRAFRKRFVEYKKEDKVYRSLDTLLISSSENKTLEDKLLWLVKLLRWLRQGQDYNQTPLQRLKFLLAALERQPHYKDEVAKVLRTAIHRVGGLELYTETGLPREIGLWGELADRIMLKILPLPPLEHDLGYLVWALFPEEHDSEWIKTIDQETFERVLDLFNYHVEAQEANWNRFGSDLQDSLYFLVIQVCALGLSPGIRQRTNNPSFSDSSFLKLSVFFEEILKNLKLNDKTALRSQAPALQSLISSCRGELDQVHSHLDEYGVSINLVFQMLRLRIYLQRIENLMELIITDKIDSDVVTTFLGHLIRENQELRSLKSLLSQNISLIARKIVERAAETGEHYITRTREEYKKILLAAAGGGAITSLAVYIKMGILSLKFPGFIEGFWVSLTYIITFVAIQLFGFTLGTKQPAMTAPALSNKMESLDSEENLNSLVTEIACLIRSQVASVLGNVFLVIPCAAALDSLCYLMFKTHLISLETAQYGSQSSDIFGVSFVFAAFTGTLLWLSSIVAGWSDNWFALNSLRKTLARSPTLIALFGKTGARSIAVFLKANFSGLAANISLGIFLGMTPVIMKFMSIPLDVRHVTISAGTLGAAIPVMGLGFLKTSTFWRSLIGLGAIASFNVAVSFVLALLTAMKARGIQPPQRAALNSALLKYFWSSPLEFFLPKETVKKSQEQN